VCCKFSNLAANYNMCILSAVFQRGDEVVLVIARWCPLLRVVGRLKFA
jgi:hypothetical protein